LNGGGGLHVACGLHSTFGAAMQTPSACLYTLHLAFGGTVCACGCGIGGLITTGGPGCADCVGGVGVGVDCGGGCGCDVVGCGCGSTGAGVDCT
jgi:hypothetical protein